MSCLPGWHLCCFSLQVSLLLGWFCHLPVDIRTAGGMAEAVRGPADPQMGGSGEAA